MIIGHLNLIQSVLLALHLSITVGILPGEAITETSLALGLRYGATGKMRRMTDVALSNDQFNVIGVIVPSILMPKPASQISLESLMIPKSICLQALYCTRQ
jgi:hypothetical protein